MKLLSFILFIAICFIVAISVANRESFAEPFVQTTQRASVLGAVNTNTIQGDFNETGTLVFYPNNVGPVPYLFYQDKNGRTVAKALVFFDAPPTDFSSWTGARISITGTLDREHVTVSRIAYISPP